jgi:hypothetical protein
MAEKPETCLLLGPASVGKRSAALFMAEKVYKCSTAVQNAVSEPLAGQVGFVVPGDDYDAVHGLLQVRGNAPVFIYSDEISPIQQEVDRVYRFGTLAYTEVIEVLTRNRLVPPSSMAAAARHSGGQIAKAVSYYKTDSSRQIVYNILKATRTGNLDLLSQSLQGLRTFYPVVVWWTEATTGQWNHFTEEGSYECYTSPALMEDIRHAAQISALGCPIQIAGRLAFWKTCERQATR